MRRLTSSFGISAALVTVAAVMTAGMASAVAAKQRVRIVSATDSAILGDRITIKAKVASPAQARKMQLQTQTKRYTGESEWTRVSGHKVKGKARQVFTPVVSQATTQRFRVVAKYASGSTVASKPVTIAVWSWTPLSAIPDYYKTSGIIDGDPYTPSFGMNGQQYLGWRTYGPYKSWEQRYTTGRECTSLRGDFGIQDDSDDGSSAQIRISNADTGALLYQSPTLTPGMIVHADVPLPAPFRVSIQAVDTSAEGIDAFPGIGSPELLCRSLTS